jgi:two-component system response regulator MprA
MGFGAHSRHVLVVDDDVDVRSAVSELLGAEGFEVHVAADGLEALALADRYAPLHAVVCDLSMPRLDGVAVVRILRRRGHDCVVVLLSGHFDLLAEAGGLGQVYALGKPFEADELLSLLHEALKGRG